MEKISKPCCRASTTASRSGDVANDEINWRRFFDINELAGLRMEHPACFEDVHALIFRLYAEGLIDGVRVDHVDGLADPAQLLPRAARRASMR